MSEKASADDPAFLDPVRKALDLGQWVFLQIRYRRSGGCRSEFLLREAGDLDVLRADRRAWRYGAAVEAHFDVEVLWSGAASLEGMQPWWNEPRLGAFGMLRGEGRGMLDVIERDTALEWLKERKGKHVVIIREPTIDVPVAYVPDADGVVRPGSY